MPASRRCSRRLPGSTGRIGARSCWQAATPPFSSRANAGSASSSRTWRSSPTGPVSTTLPFRSRSQRAAGGDRSPRQGDCREAGDRPCSPATPVPFRGEQQRVAIGRRSSRRARPLLDEPLTNLDARLRTLLRIDFKALHRETGQTILYVTHDQVEAFTFRPNRRAKSRQPPADRHAGGDLPPSRQSVRCDLHGIASDEHSRCRAQRERRCYDRDGRRLRGHRPLGAACRVAQLPRRLAIGVRPEGRQRAACATNRDALPDRGQMDRAAGAKNILDIAVGRAIIKALVRPDHPVRHEGPPFSGLMRAGCIFNPATDRFIHA